MKRLIKLMSVALCLTLVLSASLVGVFALSLNGISLGSKDKATPDEAEIFKDETVYVMAKADGTVDKIIVSDWIKNNKGADTIRDLSTQTAPACRSDRYLFSRRQGDLSRSSLGQERQGNDPL